MTLLTLCLQLCCGVKCCIYQIYFTEIGKRVFTLLVEGEIFESIDPVKIGGASTAFTLQIAKVVDDGFVSIQSIKPSCCNMPKLSGIEIVLKEVHTAHAVAQGPVSDPLLSNILFQKKRLVLTNLIVSMQYTIVDKDDDGLGVVSVDSCKILYHSNKVHHSLLLFCLLKSCFVPLFLPE